jgi:hypothetical protein
MEDWWYPVRLSCEQCSSEQTARYKAAMLPTTPFNLIDLTGGYGVDTFFMSEYATQAHYIEQNEELCRIVMHNFANTRPQVAVHNTSAEDFLSECGDLTNTLIYIDPARRDSHGGKVFRIEDCVPNIIALLPKLQQSKQVIIKLSPMLDITQALRTLQIPMDVHIVAVQNEVKEILLVSKGCETETRIHAINLTQNSQVNFAFTSIEEQQATCLFIENLEQLSVGTYIYEPNAAIIKSGAYKLVATRYGLHKMAPHTHLYVSSELVSDFPGRIWRYKSIWNKKQKDIRASIMTRNYPLTAEQLRKQLKIKDSSQYTIIGARIGEKPTLFFAERIN